ncbi:phage tail protein [Undibacterium sp. Ji42W]|uniref:phage tail protein n=1 Tax=Undibacterium sp. Ji42W TaxID=3413039 RepID=UPI003BF449D9
MPNPSATATTSATIQMPVGTIVSYASSAPPNGWLLCDGAAIDQGTHPNLYALIGANVPDLRSRFIIGAGQGNALSYREFNTIGGEENHVLSVNEMPSHNHSYGVGGGEGGDNNGTGDSEGWSTTTTHYTTWTGNTGSTWGHNNMPPFHALTYIIKY